MPEQILCAISKKKNGNSVGRDEQYLPTLFEELAVETVVHFVRLILAGKRRIVDDSPSFEEWNVGMLDQGDEED